ncbi:hypothetical protein H4R33_005947 [Dimargaris cristalligena]|nr:hypothetical protein H4R33_005947 [Dimargaris cristalligena]
MSTINAAGLLIFRLEKNQPEFLLINDTFNHRRHWTPPKGKVVGQEEVQQCAIRVTLDVAGLTIQDLQVDPDFSASIKYLSGTQAKNVTYYLARLVDPNRTFRMGAGMIHSWLPLENATDKAMYANMQTVLTDAHDYIEQNRARFAQPSPRARPAPVRPTGSSSPDEDRGDDTRRAYRPPHQRVVEGDAGNRRYPRADSGEYGSEGPRAPRPSGGRSYPTGEDGGPSSYRPPHQRRPYGPGSVDGGDAQGITYRMQSMRINHQSPNQSPTIGEGQPPQTGARPNPADSPLYKTRLCETFQTEGACPYGHKCTFAHGEAELRTRPNHGHDQGHHSQSPNPYYEDSGRSGPYGGGNPTQQSHRPNPADNPLYKTRICEKFMRDNFCPYGHKCTYAHGNEELQRRPAPQHPYPSYDNMGHSQHHHPQQQYQSQYDNQGHYTPSPYQSGYSHSGGMSSNRNREPILLEPRTPLAAPTSFMDMSANRQSLALASVETASSTQSPEQAQSPAAPEDAAKAKPSRKANKPKKSNTNGSDPRRPRIIAMDAEEMAKFTQPPPNLRDPAAHAAAAAATNTTSRAAQDELLINELRQLLPPTPVDSSTGGAKRSLTEIAKDITRFEFRHDIAKQQIFQLLIPALLDTPASLGSGPTPENIRLTLLHYKPLFSNYLKSASDQRLLLNAWDRFLTTYHSTAAMGGGAWLPKAAQVFKLNYDLDLIEEDVFLKWNAETPATSEIKKKVAPFIEWLSNAEEEDDDDSD